MTTTPQPRYPKFRIDALTDGIFAVAMTLLALDLRLPDGFNPPDAAHLLDALVELAPKFVAYAFSFALLGMRWLSQAQVTSKAEMFSGDYLRWWMLYLLLITCVPFTTTVIGRYPALAPAIWLYAANTGLLAVAAWRMAVLTPEVHDPHHMQRRKGSLAILFASSLLCIGWSFFSPRQAVWAFALNFLVTPVIRLFDRRQQH